MTKRRRQLEAVADLAARSEDEIRYHSPDTVSLLSRLALEPMAEPLPFLKECILECERGSPFPLAWQQALDQGEGLRLTLEEKEKLRAFGARLGATDREGQIAHCRRYRMEFERMATQAREQELTQTRLCRSLSALAGAGVMILFW